MSGIAVVTDSASDLDATAIEATGVRVVHLDVRLGDLGPDDTRSLPLDEFWRICANGKDVPETSAPSPGAFEHAFLQAKEDGFEGVVCVTLSSRLSATFQAACAGASAVEREIEVAVIDSRNVTMGEGLAVEAAARRAAAGDDLQAVCDAVSDHLARTAVFGTLDTLEYLHRGGRIGPAQAFFGSLLSIKPIVRVEDGVVVGEARQRTRARSLRYLVDRVAKLGPLHRLAIAHAAAPEQDLELLTELASGLELDGEPTVVLLGPVIGAHTGPGTVGLCAVGASATCTTH